MGKYREDLDLVSIKKYYERPDVSKILAELSQNKEVVGSYGGQGYAKRPDTVMYPQDIVALTSKGITSFHFSEETWSDPLRLQPGLSKQQLDQLRIGWDLIIDVDCVFLEYSMLAADLIVKALRSYEVKSVSAKFSGNHGFHIAIPFEAMPQAINGKNTASLFPEAPRLIADLLKQDIEGRISPSTGRGKLADAIWNYEAKKLGSQNNVFDHIVEKTNTTFEKLTRTVMDENQVAKTVFNAFEILEIDTILISSRHLCRMPYSVNEKSGLVSIPINPDKILHFNKDIATIENKVISRFKFLDRDACVEGEATKLLQAAYDKKSAQSTVITSTNENQRQYTPEQLNEPIPEQYFPDIIKTLLIGNLNDGKKRGLFVLGGFLFNVGWNKEQVDQKIRQWNQTHAEPLKDAYINGQLKHLSINKPLPPNFSVIAEYFGYNKDALPQRFKNPVTYAKSKYKLAQGSSKKTVSPLTNEQKEKRKAYREKKKAMNHL